MPPKRGRPRKDAMTFKKEPIDPSIPVKREIHDDVQEIEPHYVFQQNDDMPSSSHADPQLQEHFQAAFAQFGVPQPSTETDVNFGYDHDQGPAMSVDHEEQIAQQPVVQQENVEWQVIPNDQMLVLQKILGAITDFERKNEEHMNRENQESMERGDQLRSILHLADKNTQQYLDPKLIGLQNSVKEGQNKIETSVGNVFFVATNIENSVRVIDANIRELREENQSLKQRLESSELVTNALAASMADQMAKVKAIQEQQKANDTAHRQRDEVARFQVEVGFKNILDRMNADKEVMLQLVAQLTKTKEQQEYTSPDTPSTTERIPCPLEPRTPEITIESRVRVSSEGSPPSPIPTEETPIPQQVPEVLLVPPPVDSQSIAGVAAAMDDAVTQSVGPLKHMNDVDTNSRRSSCSVDTITGEPRANDQLLSPTVDPDQLRSVFSDAEPAEEVIPKRFGHKHVPSFAPAPAVPGNVPPSASHKESRRDERPSSYKDGIRSSRHTHNYRNRQISPIRSEDSRFLRGKYPFRGRGRYFRGRGNKFFTPLSRLDKARRLVRYHDRTDISPDRSRKRPLDQDDKNEDESEEAHQEGSHDRLGSEVPPTSKDQSSAKPSTSKTSSASNTPRVHPTSESPLRSSVTTPLNNISSPSTRAVEADSRHSRSRSPQPKRARTHGSDRFSPKPGPSKNANLEPLGVRLNGPITNTTTSMPAAPKKPLLGSPTDAARNAQTKNANLEPLGVRGGAAANSWSNKNEAAVPAGASAVRSNAGTSAAPVGNVAKSFSPNTGCVKNANLEPLGVRHRPSSSMSNASTLSAASTIRPSASTVAAAMSPSRQMQQKRKKRENAISSDESSSDESSSASKNNLSRSVSMEENALPGPQPNKANSSAESAARPFNAAASRWDDDDEDDIDVETVEQPSTSGFSNVQGYSGRIIYDDDDCEEQVISVGPPVPRASLGMPYESLDLPTASSEHLEKKPDIKKPITEMDSKDAQQTVWEIMKETYRKVLSRATSTNLPETIHELLKYNIIRGKYLFAAAVITAQQNATLNSDAYAAIVSIFMHRYQNVGALVFNFLLFEIQNTLTQLRETQCKSHLTKLKSMLSFLARLVHWQVAPSDVTREIVNKILQTLVPKEMETDLFDTAVSFVFSIGRKLKKSLRLKVVKDLEEYVNRNRVSDPTCFQGTAMNTYLQLKQGNALFTEERVEDLTVRYRNVSNKSLIRFDDMATTLRGIKIDEKERYKGHFELDTAFEQTNQMFNEDKENIMKDVREADSLSPEQLLERVRRQQSEVIELDIDDEESELPLPRFRNQVRSLVSRCSVEYQRCEPIRKILQALAADEATPVLCEWLIDSFGDFENEDNYGRLCEVFSEYSHDFKKQFEQTFRNSYRHADQMPAEKAKRTAVAMACMLKDNSISWEVFDAVDSEDFTRVRAQLSFMYSLFRGLSVLQEDSFVTKFMYQYQFVKELRSVFKLHDDDSYYKMMTLFKDSPVRLAFESCRREINEQRKRNGPNQPQIVVVAQPNVVAAQEEQSPGAIKPFSLQRKNRFSK